MRHIIWFSCGATSAIMSWLVLKNYPDALLVYCDTGSEHLDNKRFLSDVEKWLNTKVLVLKNEKYSNHFDVLRKRKYLNGIYGSPCTVELKKKLRFQFQKPDDIQYFGYTWEEQHRADRFSKSYPEVNAIFPLIDNRLKKEDCIGLLIREGIEIPIMYKLGFKNNNCIGCVKGGAGYWNKIKKLFPEHFEKMVQVENEIGNTCLSGIALKDLKPEMGRHKDIEINCDFVCQSFDK